MAVRMGIAGVAGRMGGLLLQEVRAAGVVLAGGTVRPGGTAPPDEVRIAPDIETLAREADVVIDFTNAAATAEHAASLAKTGCCWVLGTSGLSAEQEAIVARAAERIAVVYAPNFAPGVNLVLALAERMGAALPADTYDVEIVEMHHRQKVDAPSGTALGLGRAVARGRGVDLVAESGRDGHVGPRRTGAIGFAALRGGQVVGEHTVLFAGAAEHIALTHRAFDRRAYAAGAVRAALWSLDRPPGLYSMLDVLGMGRERPDT